MGDWKSEHFYKRMWFYLATRIVIDADTGEVLTRLEEGDRIIRSKSIEYLEDFESWKKVGFFKGYTDELRMVIPTLSTTEKAVLLSLLPYVSATACDMKFSNGIEFSNGKDMKLEGVIKVCGLSRNTTVDVINSLVKKDILYKGRNSKGNQFFMNPWLIHRGGTINKTLKTMFENYRIKTKGNVKWKDL